MGAGMNSSQGSTAGLFRFNRLPLPRIALRHDAAEIGERAKVVSEHQRLFTGGAREESATRHVRLPGIHIDSGQHIAVREDVPVDETLISPRQREVVACLTEIGSASLRQIERRLGRQGVQSAVYGLVRRGVLITFQKMADPRVKTRRERTVELLPTDPRWVEAELPKLEKRAPKQAECIRRLWEAARESRTERGDRRGGRSRTAKRARRWVRLMPPAKRSPTSLV